MKKALFLAFCVTSIILTHAEKAPTKLFRPAPYVLPQAVGWLERLLMQQPTPTPYIPTIHVGWLDITKDIERYEEILLPLTNFLENDAIDAIILRIDSNGGSPADTQIIADYIRAAQQQKPVIAFISHSGTSCAYWIASACTYVICPSAADVGNIGILSQMIFEKNKRYYFIGSGKFKAPDIDKEQEISPEYIEYFKTIVQESATIFANEVSEYRNIPVEKILSWEAALFTGATALTLGLVDQNGTMHDVLEKAVQLTCEKNNITYKQLKLINSEYNVLKTYQL